jgi:release factor glutamine methyltransferase
MDSFKVIESDLFERIEGKFDFILTNPPYIDPAIDRAEESVKNHEPHLALYGGDSGMEIIGRIIATAPDYLNEGGQLWIEHEPEQVEAIQKSAEAAGFCAVTHKDQYGVDRFSILI